MKTYTDAAVPKGHVKIIYDDGREEFVKVEELGDPQKLFSETFSFMKAMDKDRYFFPRPDPGLGEPQRKFSETFSAMDAIKQRLVDKLKEKSQTDSPFLGTNFDYK